jgi:S-adenosylmethionine decarboxylase
MQSPRYHVIFDLERCRNTIADEETLKRFIEETVAAIGMHVLAGPVVCEGVPENPGLSAFAVLDYSHASIHTFTRHNEAMIDVFSCKPFDREVVRKQCVAYFASPSTVMRARTVWWEGESA